MRRWPLLLVAVLVIALAAPAAARPTGERPIKGTMTGEVLAIVPPTPERCDLDNKPWAIVSFEGWGATTHLGWTHVYAEHCSYSIDGTPDTATGLYGEGRLILTAANGDVLLGSYTAGVSTSGPPTVGFMDQVTFLNGGTGRFAEATGSGTEIGSVDFSSGFGPGAPFEVTMTGSISYDASNASIK